MDNASCEVAIMTENTKIKDNEQKQEKNAIVVVWVGRFVLVFWKQTL